MIGLFCFHLLFWIIKGVAEGRMAELAAVALHHAEQGELFSDYVFCLFFFFFSAKYFLLYILKSITIYKMNSKIYDDRLYFRWWQAIQLNSYCMYYFLQEIARSSSLAFCLCNPSCSYKKGNRWQTGGRFAGLFCNSLSTFKPHEKTAKTRKATKLTGPGIDENEEHDGAEDIFIWCNSILK